MNPSRLLRAFTTARTTIALLCALALLLLLNVALPQRQVVGEQRFAQIVEGSAAWRFLLVRLGLGTMSTSPVFLATLGLFLLNLVAVLASRVGPTWRRVALKPRAERGLQAWTRLEESRRFELPAGWSAGAAASTLRGYGYQVRRPGERTLWAVKHRTAPLGFLLFHVSFLLLVAGGVTIHYTRFVGAVVLSEGQSFAGVYTEIVRARPFGPLPELPVTLERVDSRFERGEVVHLGAAFRFRQGTASVQREARVNHPARWGATRLLVTRAGLAPVLWLQDPSGFTVDRVVVPARSLGGPPTDVALADERTVVFILPLAEGENFPGRDELARAAVALRVTQGGRVVFDGALRPGEGAELEDGRLVLEDLRYWVGLNVVAERGGALLVAGFVVGILGLIWRLLWYRREVALTWDDREANLVGRTEYFSDRFERELAAVRTTLERGAPG